MVSDPLSDILIQVKNAQASGKKRVIIPFSKFTFEIAKSLAKEGFIASVDKKLKKDRNYLFVELAYTDEGAPRVAGVKRLSKPSRRLYGKAQDLKAYASKRGRVFLSTPKGVATASDAMTKKTGGEILFHIW